MKLAIVIPSFQHQTELNSVLRQLPKHLGKRTYVIDDGSHPPLQAPNVSLIRHSKNQGYGAAQKSGFRAALHSDAELVALIHGDDQYDPSTILSMQSRMSNADIALGSRMLIERGKQIPSWRRYGNRLLTQLANWRFGSHCSDLHTGARLYHRSLLEQAPWEDFSNDFLFDQQILLWSLAQKKRLIEFPMIPKYNDSVSSISFGKSLHYGLGCVYQICFSDYATK